MTISSALSHKVTARHLQRQAMLYVRQSTLHQVLENTESTARQYALRERAVGLGWETSHIVVIDQDLGQSGASAADREGLEPPGCGGGIGTCRARDGVRSLSFSTQFPRLAPFAGTVCHDGDPHSRRRWTLRSSHLQRPSFVGDERRHERSRIACAARAPERRHSQQSPTSGPQAPITRGAGLRGR
jgi:hypothetical protein